MYVRLPPGFTDVHKEITHRFVQGESFSQAERALRFRQTFAAGGVLEVSPTGRTTVPIRRRSADYSEI